MTQSSWLGAVGLATVLSVGAAVLLAPTATPRSGGTTPAAVRYVDHLATFVGKPFYLSAEWSVATQKSRTSVVPAGAIECTLVGVGEDYAFFDGPGGRVCVPIVALRTVLIK